MNVKLISVSEPRMETGCRNAEDLMVYCARVSNPSNQSNTTTAHRLLKYCLRNGHWSVFETATMTLEIETSRAIAAQLLRHRSFTFQEFSQRYAEADLGFETCEARAPDPVNRQNSTDTHGSITKQWWADTQEACHNIAQHDYELALKNGIAKEQARMLLPLSTRTRLYMTGSVRSWIHYLQARTADGTQREHRDLALAVKDIFAQQFPLTFEALEDDMQTIEELKERIKQLEEALRLEHGVYS